MGEVYRARDTRLGREVAVKVLPEHLSANPEDRARFEREARTISQLDHPHICTLFDVGQQGDTFYLVMELLQGESLAHRLERGALPLADVLTIGRQIAEALDRAHRAGVVHRDLKPGNVMLVKTGAKLLDFGLARSAGLAADAGSRSHSPTMSRPLTIEGAIAGTFQYMAPEVLEGREADARSDLWALGCVLYEMATGARAFEGTSQASVIAAIMTGEPPPMTELKPVTPPALEQLVRRCLRKDPEARPQSARDVAFILELIAGESLGAAQALTAPGRRRAFPWIQAGVAAALLALGFLAGRLAAPPPRDGSIRVSTLSQGTRDTEPAVSPDGRLIAFSAVRQDGQGIWVMDMVTRGELKLTRDADRSPRFSADGGSILFTRAARTTLSLWRVPVIGGTPRLLLEGAWDADPSPDGKWIAYVAGPGDSGGLGTRLMVAKSDGTAGRKLWKGNVLLTSPRWSPDSRRISIILSGSQNTANAVVVVDASNGSSRIHPSPNGAVLSNAAWDASGNAMIVAEGVGVTAVQSGAPGHLMRLDARSGAFQPLGWLENFPVLIDLLPDGRLVMSSLIVRQNLREVALDARSLVDGRWLTTGLAMDRQPAYSPDGRTVMFSSNRGGSLDLWEVSVESGEMHRVTDDPADDWDPAYSPDGSSFVWCSKRSGAYEIWTARRDGSAPRQVSRDSLDAEHPSISPDSRWVPDSSANGETSGLWEAPRDGG